ncbi:cytochrome P450 [Saccharata proteae CBS 121410]|uniref:Cytochrome P450 n=1 Tax=Saccharata proteae CBS 121410 TaxID=1314787 RepID=A0A9P4HRS6_9PEZI|nr:cytochrome P450 [Saccharata proteae CBS 121410]
MNTYSKLEEVPLVPIAAALITLSYFFFYYLQRPVPINAPLVGSDLDGKERVNKYVTDVTALLAEGYHKFKNGIYRLATTEGESLVLSSKYLDELKNAPDDVVNFNAAILTLMAGKYSHLGDKDVPLAKHVIKSDLTPALPRLQPIISEEVNIAFERRMPPCNDWTPIVINKMLLNIVAQVSARVFVGEPLCRNQRWIDISRDYTVLAFAGAHAIKKWKPWMRPFVAPFVPELRDLERVRGEALKFMAPIAKDRQQSSAKMDDLTQWMLNKAGVSWLKDYRSQADVQVQLALAAIHTTTMTTTHILYDLATYPEFIEPLREELRTVLKETNGMQKETMNKLKKLDSFMKESQRFNPPGFTTFKRRIMKDLTLHDGLVLPKGTLVEIDSSSMNSDSTVYENPDVFDGLRFVKLRERSAEDFRSHMFATSNPSANYLSWGAGKHVCPGRFFASNEIKTIIAKILLDYDIKMADGQVGRPKNFSMGVQLAPNPTLEMLFKKVAA